MVETLSRFRWRSNTVQLRDADLMLGEVVRRIRLQKAVRLSQSADSACAHSNGLISRASRSTSPGEAV
jgi:hypothetical protein